MGESYLSAEMQSMYSTVPATWLDIIEGNDTSYLSQKYLLESERTTETEVQARLLWVHSPAHYSLRHRNFHCH